MANYNERIAAAKEKIEQYEKQMKELLQKQKAQERKSRTRRLCERGGKIEKLFPRLIEMTEEQFELFVEKTLLTGYAEKVIKQILQPPATTSTEPKDGNGTPQDSEPAAQKSTETAVQSNPIHAAKPAKAEQNNDTATTQTVGNGTGQGV